MKRKLYFLIVLVCLINAAELWINGMTPFFVGSSLCFFSGLGIGYLFPREEK